MGDSRARSREERDPRSVEVHAVRMPHVGTRPSQRLGVLGRRLAELLATVRDVGSTLRQMRVQAHAVTAGKERRVRASRLP